MSSKLMETSQALELIQDGDTITFTSAGMVGYAEHISKALENKFLEEQRPGNLTLVSGCGQAVWDERGDSRFGHPGFLKRVICTHPDAAPPVRKMLENNEIEGYILTQGVLNQLLLSIAAQQPGLLTKIGTGTYIDPRLEGGKVNEKTKEDLVEVMNVKGEEWLFYNTFPINVAIIRGSTADENGNLTIEREGLKLQLLAVASAANASGGKVIVQAERVAKSGTLNPKDVVVPGILVDAVVVPDNPMEDHKQTAAEYYNPAFSGELKMPVESGAENGDDKLTLKNVVTRRAAQEMSPGMVVNFGIGIPAAIGEVAAQEGIYNSLTLTVELGVIGGIPADIPNFGVAFNPEAFVSHPEMFDFYHSEGLDITFLGAAQIDKNGNINVSKFGPRISGTGGFIDITQSTPRIVFCSYFKAKGLEGIAKDGTVTIENEGSTAKFVEDVDQVSFSGPEAIKQNKDVTVVTERAVFKLSQDGLMLTEIAPGLDLEKDILQQMEFRPIISDNLKTMDERIFQPGRMGCFD